MSRKTHIILLLLAGFLLAHVKARGQNISEIAQSDPLIITGTIGTQNTYRYSSAGTEYGSPFSTMLYANMNVALYGISMPFAISYSNSNVEYNYPHLSLAFMPQYKDWTGYIGESTMAMSPLWLVQWPRSLTALASRGLPRVSVTVRWHQAIGSGRAAG